MAIETETVKLQERAIGKQAMILDVLQESGPRHRTDIVRITGIPWTTTYDNLRKLEIKKRVTRYKIIYGRGRPTIFWRSIMQRRK